MVLGKFPEHIPDTCGECSYYERIGGAGSFRGYCGFYQRDVSVDWECYALEIDPSLRSKPVKPQDDHPSPESDSRCASGAKFDCPVCGRGVVVWHTAIGDLSECPACGAPLTIPRSAERISHSTKASSSDGPQTLASDASKRPAPAVPRDRSPAAAAPVSAAATPPIEGVRPRNNSAAITGLVLGIASVVFWSFAVVPAVAVVFSSIGLARVSEYGSGRPQAWIGLVLGAIYVVMGLMHLVMGRW